MNEWICMAYTLDAASVERLTEWTVAAGLPAQAPHRLHLTAAYSRSGYGDAAVAQLTGPVSFRARPTRVDRFDVGDHSSDVPVVLVCDGDFAAHAVSVQDRLDALGFEVVRHPDGYNAHITIAKLPAVEASCLVLPDAPEMELVLDGLVELHSQK